MLLPHGDSHSSRAAHADAETENRRHGSPREQGAPTGQSRARGTTAYGKCLQSRAKKGLVTLGPQGKLKTAPPLYATRKLTSGRSQIPTGKAERASVQMKTQKDVR